MLLPVSFETDLLHIHHFRSEDLIRYDKLVKDIYRLLSDEETLRFIPEKKINSLAEADGWLKSAILNFHCGRNYVHFITEKNSGKLLGMIDIISPQTVKANYKLDQYPHFIEFYLCGKSRGRKIMSTVLPKILSELHHSGISFLGAAVDHRNMAAQKVLLNAGFNYRAGFDPIKDLYQFSAKETP